MPDASRRPTRLLLVAVGLAVVVFLLVLARGPVALLAAAMVAVITGYVVAVPPLLRHDAIDWDWRPSRAQEIPPEPGIATLRRLLAPADDEPAAARQLHELVRAIAADLAGDTSPGGRLGAYLDGPPRRLDLTEAEAVITELEALRTKEHH